MAEFTYMGTKRLLAPRIAALVREMADGPLLDLFSGIAAVGTEIGLARPIWCNDVQHFSKLLTRRKFTSARAFFEPNRLVDAATPVFASNQAALVQAFSSVLAKEQRALHTTSPAELSAIMEEIATVGSATRDQLRADGHHCLFATTHAGTYFGLSQAIAIDSIRSAADRLALSRAITPDEHEWMILALCQALSTSTNSTGHFAQYLSPNATNLHRILRKRRQDIWGIWQTALGRMQPLGTVRWRRGNRVFSRDAVELLRKLAGKARQPAVIYADPPYTSDQYSRYYHVLENCILYDYPKTAGKGQYRPDRFTSGFSLRSTVGRSFAELVAAASKLDAVLILSYPTNGLLAHSTGRLLEILNSHYAYVEAPVVVPHMHSTMGGSKGAQKQAVEENVFIAYQRPAMRHRGAANPRAGCGAGLSSRATVPHQTSWVGADALESVPA